MAVWRKGHLKWISRNWDTFSLIPYEYKAIGSNTAKTDREFDWLICRQSQDNGSPYSALSLSVSLYVSLCPTPVFSPRAGGCYVNSDSAHYQPLRSELELTGFGPGRGQLDPTATMASVCVYVCVHVLRELITKRSFISKSHPKYRCTLQRHWYTTYRDICSLFPFYPDL